MKLSVTPGAEAVDASRSGSEELHERSETSGGFDSDGDSRSQQRGHSKKRLAQVTAIAHELRSIQEHGGGRMRD